ncbi:hypothetical protein BJY52DRAFT_164838 [Lactarius psammicola]|nr:hypothetical protein BJY52DRAFT_164838 [Lactarius psammicola]
MGVSPLSTDSSPQSYYTPNGSPWSHIATNSTSTLSSSMSFPYTVASIVSRKSRKNVLYPRRVHPLPVAVSSERSVSPDALIWQVRFLCTALLPYAETRLVPAGRVLLQSLGPALHENISQRVPIRADEDTRCCSELFIALTHEVLLKDAIGAGELEGPCKLLHTTFKNILFKLGAFSLPTTPKSNEAGRKESSTEVLTLERSSSVLHALSSVMGTFEGALDSIKPTTAKDGALGDQHRMALLELSVYTGLTMELYRKKLDQNLAQTRTQLNSLLGPRQPEGLLPHPTSLIPVIHPHEGAAKSISTIEEGSEAEGSGSSATGHTQSHSVQSHSSQGYSDSGKRTSSLSRRILSRLIPSSISKKRV